ncbi:MAG: hypothetical protein ALECFALPRED_002911 [Alectoria fallacina]|uniref:Oxidase ustYa n=1 Tax=Alectoria fallacina TaxID=1903189 RepID=A0A8H3FJZ0_9LECA|nr:MAG: hypothetical protein ALECFALPRED_002911 [Alectoria fallacina]
MPGFLERWRQEAQGLYRRVPEGDEMSDGKKDKFFQSGGVQFVVGKIYQVAPFLLLLNLGFAAVLSVQGLSHFLKRSKAFAPETSIETMEFEESATFMAPASPESNAAWEALRPKGGGAVVVPNAKAYGLKSGIPMETGPDVYGVSMFHQLHCLTVIRASYYAALNGTLPPFTQPGIELLSEEKRLMLLRGHTAHCFDYLRQGIMCAGDLTIESAVDFPEKWLEGISEGILREKFGEHKPVLIDGWGIKHQCRSFDEAWDWTFRNRVPDDSGVVL